MLLSEQLRVLLFLAVVLAVCVRAAVLVFGVAARRFARTPSGGGPSGPPKPLRWWDACVLVAAAGGMLCGIYGFIEPYRVTVTHVRIATSKLARGARPIRIVHVSDLHSDPRPRLEGRLPALIAAQSPDLIVFTGDAINSPRALPVFQALLARLATIAPTFAVKGNWDTWFWSDLRPLEVPGVRELDGEGATLTVRGATLWIGGVAVGHESAARRLLEDRPPDLFGVFLYHYPDLMPDVARTGVDLYCAGHTHGGQIALPFYGALVTLSRFGKRYESGLYHEGSTWLYVNRGIGMEGGMPRVRFWAPPEVTVIEVVPRE
jgi:predicted MPP superfamily phosphohydrolase